MSSAREPAPAAGRRPAGTPAATGAQAPDPRRLYLDTLYTAATMYYVEDATQAQVSARLGKSRTTVSRLLSEARRLGIVRTEVVRPQSFGPGELAGLAREATGLRGVHVGSGGAADLAVSLGPALHDALADAGLSAGDVLLVSSGRHTFEMARAPLPRFPGVRVVPTIGGIDQSDAWYQPNETVRHIAAKLGGTPLFLFAPALPRAGLHEELMDDPGTRRVLEAWDQARCAIVGVGAPPRTRQSLPSFVDTTDEAIMSSAGDVASRFYDADGVPVLFDGVERLVATPLERFRTLERCIAVASGTSKVPSILAGARAGYFTDLVTDEETATALISS